MQKDSYKIIGLMSGTSLDGLDLCYTQFKKNDDMWDFQIVHALTIPYPIELIQRLQQATSLTAIELYSLDQELGNYFSDEILLFMKQFNIKKNDISCIASHGHTIYHQPQKNITVQIGCGTSIAYKTGIKVINDFRKKDVIAGGQGAPLVPIGDDLLFRNEAESFLNIGGFANISFKKNHSVEAFDICPANILINLYMRKLGHSFDFNGNIARSYPIHEQLLEELNSHSMYEQEKPKSLGIEWLEQELIPIIEKYDCSIETKIATITQHSAFQMAQRLNQFNLKSVLITGGGAKNTHLITQIASYYSGEIKIPSEEIIDFKEAIIFAFLGLLYLENEVNCLSSVTGAQQNVIGGVLHIP